MEKKEIIKEVEANAYPFVLDKEGNEMPQRSCTIDGRDTTGRPDYTAWVGDFPYIQKIMPFEVARKKMKEYAKDCLIHWSLRYDSISLLYRRFSKWSELHKGDTYYEYCFEMTKGGKKVLHVKFVFVKAEDYDVYKDEYNK